MNGLLLLLAAVTLARLTLTIMLPPVADESYYCLWQDRLDWSYVDHPAMVAWLPYPLHALGASPLVAGRTMAWLAYALSAILVFDTVRVLSGDRLRSARAALLYLVVPYDYLAGIAWQVEQPLLLFSMVVLWAFVRFDRDGSPRWLLPVALGGAGALLSKYTAVLPLGATLLALLGNARLRAAARTTLPWLALAALLAGLIPIVGWNASHDWGSFRFHLGRLGETRLGEFAPEFLLNQVLFFSPFLWAGLWSLRKTWREWPASWLWAWAGATIGAMALLSFRTHVWGHWAAVAVLPLIVLAGWRHPRLGRLTAWVLGFTAALTLLLGSWGPGVFLQQSRYAENRRLADKLAALESRLGQRLPVVADFHGSVGQLSHYMPGRRVFFPVREMRVPGRWGEGQFAMWGALGVPAGGTAVFFGAEYARARLERLFASVSELPWRLAVLEPHVAVNRFYLCRNARKAFEF